MIGTSLASAVLVAAVSGLAVIGLAIRSRARVMRRFNATFAESHSIGAGGIVTGAEPFELVASPSHAVLLIHGFGDTPQSVRYLAEALHRAGWSVNVLLLPGHGRSLRDYAAARGSQWIAFGEQSYRELANRYETVVVCGISMGAALAVILAAENPEIPAVALLAPYLVMPRRMRVKAVLASLAAYPFPFHANSGSDRSIHDPVARLQTLGTGAVAPSAIKGLQHVSARARRLLPQVHARALYLQSREDNRIGAHDAEVQFLRLGSAVREQRWLAGCGHIITADYCKDEVARQVIGWFALELAAG